MPCRADGSLRTSLHITATSTPLTVCRRLSGCATSRLRCGSRAQLLFSAKPVIQWHQHANHGLSSQVCCVNFLLPFAERPELLRRWVEHVTGDKAAEMLPVERDRAGRDWFVTFEWIGDVDHLNESRDGAVRKRGANATAADAAVMYRDRDGRTQLLLIEWKYTERYGQPLAPDGNATRRERYQHIFRQSNGPIRADADVTLDDFFWEPFYQMLRQQMLAWHTQRADNGIDRARVLHLSPTGNRALHKVTSPALRRFGDDAFDVFRSLLADPADFIDMSIEQAFAPLASWPEADWYPWLSGPLCLALPRDRGTRLMARKPGTPKQVDALKHDAASRRNIPTAEMESFFRREEDRSPMPPKHYPRARPLAEGETRTRGGAERARADLERRADHHHRRADGGAGRDRHAHLVRRAARLARQGPAGLVRPRRQRAAALHPGEDPPQGDHRRPEAPHRRRSARRRPTRPTCSPTSTASTTRRQRAEFYQHDQHWSNRMILGDSLQVMASLAERESLRGQGAVHLFRPALRHQVQLELAGLDAVARREGRQADRHQPRARAGEGIPRHLEGRHPLLPDLSARPADRRCAIC